MDRHVLYWDFKKQSPLDVSLRESDHTSFNLLLEELVKRQSTINCAHLVDSWLLKAIPINVDLRSLFRSKLVSCKLTSGSFRFSEQFISKHQDEHEIVNHFTGSIIELMHSPNVYSTHFKNVKAKIEVKEPDDSDDNYNEIPAHSRDNENYQKNLLKPIRYTADYLFSSEDKHSMKKYIELFTLLSDTKTMTYFESPFI